MASNSCASAFAPPGGYPVPAAASAAVLRVTDSEEVEAVLLMRQLPQLRSHWLAAMRADAHATTVAQLRRRVLIPAVLAKALSFLPVAEQLLPAQVSSEWRAAVQHPSLWRSSGWWATRFVERPNAMPLPPSLYAQLPFLRCGINWLLSAAPLGRVSSFVQLRHLELQGLPGDATVSADELRQALSPLRLQSLLLPHGAYGPCILPPALVAALSEPSAQGQPSLLATWAPNLTRLRCEVFVEADDGILHAASSIVWSSLRWVDIALNCGGCTAANVAATQQRLQRWWSPQSAPVLTSLTHHMHGNCDECLALDFPLLSGVPCLTELGLHWERERGALDLLRKVSGDVLPQLRHLSTSGNKLTAPAPDDDENEAIALLQRMPLTALRLQMPSSLSLLLQHLPHLRELSSRHSLDRPALSAVAAAPQLQKLILGYANYEDVLSLLKQWWRRMGCPLLRTDGRVDEEEWRRWNIAEQADPLERHQFSAS